MQKRKADKAQKTESLFERLLREDRLQKQLVKHDAFFLGVSVLVALYATQGMFTIQ